MKRPAIFFDRDNTLIVSDGYLGDPSNVVLIQGAADAVARARQLGYAVVVVSNQSGVARGMFGEDDVHAVNARLDEVLRAHNADAIIDRHEFCPFHPEAVVEAYRRDSDRRKPGAGMILEAAQALALDLSRSWLIGDAPRDVEAGHAAGCRTILFRDESLAASPAAAQPMQAEPEVTVTTLKQAIDYIASAQQRAAVDREGDDDVEDIPETFAPGDAGRTDDEESKPYLGHVGPELRPDMRPDVRPVPVRISGAAPASRPQPAVRIQQPAPAPHPIPTARLESFAEQILQELRRRTEMDHAEFSVSKLLGGIVQVMSIAVMFLAYLNRTDRESFMPLLIFGVWLQVLTVALLVMGRQK